METTTLAERLTEVMQDLNLKSQADLARFTDCTRGLVGQWFSGRSNLGRKPLLAFEAKTNISTTWLATGTGNKFRTGDHIIPATSGVAISTDYANNGSHIEIPRYDVNLSAGSGNGVWIVREKDEPLLFRKAWFKKMGLSPDSCKAMYVRGDSMEPDLLNYDTVIIDTLDTEITDGDIYALTYKNQFYIKKIVRTGDSIQLVSSNQHYEPIVITEQDFDKLQILGRKVWRGG